MTNLVQLSTSPEEHVSNGHNHDALARGYIEALARGETPERPEVGKWKPLCTLLDDTVKGDADAVKNALKASGIHKRYPGLKELLNPPVAHSSASGRRPDEKTSRLEDVKDNDNPYPPLPEGIRLDPSLAGGACPLREEYERYSQKLSPEGYEEFHEACFWAMISMVAARRVYTDMDSRIYTSLYIVLAAKTSLFAKTETANVTKKVLKAAGLDWLLGANRTTPQKLMSDMAGKYIPEDYDELPYDEQELLKLRLAMSGQVGWIYDEFGKFVRGMLRQNSVMADFDELFLSFEGSPDSYKNATIARNSEPIKRPYLALLGCMTPASVRFSAKAGTESWSDGFWPRFAFITPPIGTEKDSPFTRGEKPVPSSISTPLRMWHDRLGVPEIDIVPKIDDKGKATGKHEKVIVREHQETKIALSDVAYNAWVCYRSALKSMLKNFPHEDLHGSYDRLPVKALRIATLVASLENSTEITLQHWALAQGVAESWRSSLHRFYVQVNDQRQQSGPTLEEKVIETVQKFCKQGNVSVSARDVAKALHKDSKDIVPYMRTLARDGVFEEIAGRQNPRYKIRRIEQEEMEDMIEEEL